MRRSWLARVFRGILWRIIRSTNVGVFKATSLSVAHPVPPRLTLVRISNHDAAGANIAEKAMQTAGEKAGLVAARMIHGDEFFGWRSEAQIVTFGWVTQSNRSIGATKLLDAPGRLYFYNFHTLKEYRGRGLYPALLLSMRQILSEEGASEFIIDVNTRNTASTRGVEKAGFEAIAEITFLSVLDRWACCTNHVMLNNSLPNLFAASKKHQRESCRKTSLPN